MIRQYSNPHRISKKLSNTSQTCLVKTETRPIRDKAGRILEKIRPILIPNYIDIINSIY